MSVEDANNPSWVVELGKMVAAPTSSRSGNRHYIHRVPQWITEMSSRMAYTPSVVSLGPFHHGDPALLPMEAHKRRAVATLVRRSGKPLREFVGAVEEEAPRLAAAYERLGVGEDYYAWFVEVMLIDCCFLLELARAFVLEGDVGEDYGFDDPVFSKHGYRNLRHVLTSDVLLMENQVPMFLLKKILTILGGSESYFMMEILQKEGKLSLLHCWIQGDYLMSNNDALHPLQFFLTWGPRSESAVSAASSASFAFWNAFRRRPPHCSDSESDCAIENEDYSESMPTATELYEAGIHFMATSTALYGEWRMLEAISFERGILTIPVVQVDDYTKKKYLNLMAFERLEPGAGNDTTDFIFFMDGIIDSAKDVALLRSSGVIVNLLGSDEEVADLFSKVLAKGAALSRDSRLRGVYRGVNAHCSKPWNKWRAMFMQTYMSNPWVFISLVAAVILLVATLVQTFYSAASFYQE